MPNEWSKKLGFNLEHIKSEITKSCLASHRHEEDVQLVAVSKGQDFSKIKIAYDLGLRHFGESYAKELAAKLLLAKDMGLHDIKWHFIGAIQTNKIKIIAAADFVHSVGSIAHAQALSHAASKSIEVFLQVNLSESSGRQGFSDNEVVKAAGEIETLAHLHLLGLMTILPLSPSMPNHYWFSRMAHLRAQINPQLKLSMGMSGDFYDAIVAGTNFIRLGESLFGPRSSQKN